MKKVISVIIAIITLSAMFSLTASAADSDISFKVNCDKDGYIFTVYQLATIDTATGTYTMSPKLDEKVAKIISSATAADSKSVIAACDKVTDSAALGKIVATYTSNTGVSQINVPGGLYYIKATTTPAEVKAVTNTYLPLPYFDNGAWVNNYPDTINLAAKVSEKSPDNINPTTAGDGLKTAGAGDGLSTAGGVVATGTVLNIFLIIVLLIGFVTVIITVKPKNKKYK